MPSLNVSKNELVNSIGVKISTETLENTVFDFGVELDDIYEENGETMYKFDVPANRYDLLCLEGFSSALKCYMGLEKYSELSCVGDMNGLSIARLASAMDETEDELKGVVDESNIARLASIVEETDELGDELRGVVDESNIARLASIVDETDELEDRLRGVDNNTTTNNVSNITVTKHKTHEREHIACAIIKGIEFTDISYDSFINYQDKLHSSIGRNRSLLAIGTHDLSKICGTIEYKSVDLKDINFTPLSGNKSINGADLREYYEKDKKISKFFNLLSDPSKSVVFTMAGSINNDVGDSIGNTVDSNIINNKINNGINNKINNGINNKTDTESTVMSMPPIINSEKTKISKNTKDIFIEVTGTDFNKVNTALKLILYNFRGKSIEKVKIIDNGNSIITPIFHSYKYTIPIEKIVKKLQVNLTTEEVKNLLEKMMYKIYIKNNQITVTVPDIRSDVLHECDILEDISIAYGFNNFEKRIPSIYTVGSENPLNKFTDKIRTELVISGFNEVLTLTLLSKNENFINSRSAVILSNPKSKEYEVVRTSLLPGILKSISSNLHGRIPIKVLEVSDIVLLHPVGNTSNSAVGNTSNSTAINTGITSNINNTSNSADVARNERRACAVIASNKSLLEDVQGPLSLLFEKCGFTTFEYSSPDNFHDSEYSRMVDDQIYLDNQWGLVKVDGEVIGSIGVLHPNTCKRFGICYAASAFEISIENLFDKFQSKK